MSRLILTIALMCFAVTTTFAVENARVEIIECGGGKVGFHIEYLNDDGSVKCTSHFDCSENHVSNCTPDDFANDVAVHAQGPTTVNVSHVWDSNFSIWDLATDTEVYVHPTTETGGIPFDLDIAGIASGDYAIVAVHPVTEELQGITVIRI